MIKISIDLIPWDDWYMTSYYLILSSPIIFKSYYNFCPSMSHSMLSNYLQEFLDNVNLIKKTLNED